MDPLRAQEGADELDRAIDWLEQAVRWDDPEQRAHGLALLHWIQYGMLWDADDALDVVSQRVSELYNDHSD